MQRPAFAPTPGIYATARDVTKQKGLERGTLEVKDQESERLGRAPHHGSCQTGGGITAMRFALSRKLEADFSTAATAVDITRLPNEANGQTRDLRPGSQPGRPC